MKIRISLVLAGLLLLTLALPTWASGPEVSYGQAIHHDTSPPLSEMAGDIPLAAAGENRTVPIGIRPDFAPDPAGAAPDGGLQLFSVPSFDPTPPPILSVSGLSEADNSATVGFAVVPPDTNGDIGLDDAGNRIYIQYINSVWGVFDITGALIHGPFPGNSFWTGFGGPCEANNDGDPVVLYDDQAGQWFFSQFSINEGVQCVAVSATSDPLGPYHRYAFTVTPGGANDYPKLGVWDDGTTGSTGQSAYTFTTRDFGGAGGAFSVGAGVMERDAMLVGDPASFIKFINPCVAGDCNEGQLPPHLAGGPPPAGTCPTFWTAVDAAFDDSPFPNDGYRNHTLCVDWSNLPASTYTEGPLVVAGSNFDRFLAGGVVSPVNGGEALDALQFFTMYRAQYRWYGDNGRVVLNTTVDAGGDRAGIRWAETRSADGDSGWFLQQDGTFAPDDGIERWMGSIAADQDGNIALGYSAASGSLFPAVRYTTRSAGDPLGTMAGGEVSCHEGGGAQVGSSNRWGDYSSMSVDPTDDCTFWYTQEYYETTSSFNFNTRICSFRFPDCGGGCVVTEDPEETCNDGLDNDCDGDYDCTDSDCEFDDACICIPDPAGEICTDGVDNDCDGLVDCGDPDCEFDDACVVPPAPENDLCEDAILIECGETISGQTETATFDDVGTCGTSNTAPGVWYKTAAAGALTVSTCNQADFDTKLSVFEGECGDLGCIGGVDDSAGCGLTTEFSWVSDGSENLVLVHGFGGATGNFDLTLTCGELIEGDICEDAIGPLDVGSVTSGSTTDANPDEPPSIDCGTSVTAPGVWYTVVGTGNTMTASTCNDGDPSTGSANYDTKISVYCADCEVKECIGGQDDAAGCSGFSTSFDWPTVAGNTYNVFVHGFGSATGDFELAILDDGVPYEGPALNDCDGVPGAIDYCPGTVQPEAAPTVSLKPNNSALTGNAGLGVFETAAPNPQGVLYTIEDTAGCSCEQIVDLLGKGSGHLKHGCSFSVMDEWLEFTSGLCGDCLIANGTPGCQNGECEAAVCAIDSFCCDVFWDSICAAEANEICEPDLCEGIPTEVEPCGDCLVSNGTPGCENGACEEVVCAVDSFCCAVVWDSICAAEAADLCGPDICDASAAPIEGGRAFGPELMSKDRNFTPKPKE